MILIGLTGRAQAGKDSVADYLEQAHGVYRTAFADAIKNALYAALGEDMDEGDKEAPIAWIGKSRRELMQTLGTEWGRQLIGEDIWIRALERNFTQWEDAIAHCAGYLMITDVRFENEARWVRAHGGTIWLIRRPAAPLARAHSSEAGIPEELVSRVIDNDGTLPALHAKVNAAFHELLDIVSGPAQ